MEGMSPEELAAMLYRALMDGNDAIMRALARAAVTQFAGMEPGRPVGGTYYLYRTLRQLDLEGMLSRMMDEVHEQNPGGLTDLEEGQSAALIDFDNDGRMDVVVASMGAPLLFYRNLSPNPGHWVGLRLVGPAGMRTPFGAKVFLRRDDGKTPVRELYPANGFRGQSDPRIHFGLGAAPRVPDVDVRWPDGKKELFKGLAIDAYQDVRYGEGVAE